MMMNHLGLRRGLVVFFRNSMTRSVSGVYDIRFRVSVPSFRNYKTSSVVHHGGPHIDKSSSKLINIHWIKDGTNGEIQKITTSAYVGETLLQVAHHHEIELEGACEGVCACSTCHTILPDDLFSSLDPPSEEEEDMLDMAFGLEETSRLGCQVTLTEEMDGREFRLPAATRNFYVDGHVPKPH
mmetsp:Transcript_16988/g.34024  ORF Transcript_16988/g.34024 Transcript_16988/m.34024 type:complete len:183 (-) Transcript_16988:87-635(-)